jgi:intraflagellar transport protein 74
MKQRALQYFRKLSEAREKKNELELFIETAKGESGPQEKARLLEQVKNDNLETSAMERKIAELEDKIRTLKDQLGVLTGDLDANQGKFNLTQLKNKQST